MKKGWLLTILSIGLTFSLVSTTNAGFNFGVKYLSMTKYFEFEEASVPELAFHLGAEMGENAVVFGGFELLKGSYKEELTGADAYSYKEEGAITIITPFFGGRYYFKPRSNGQMSFYISGLLFKSLASVDIDTGDPDEDKWDEEYLKELNSPFGFTPAFGAEYYFSDHFSIGGETGIKFSFAKAEVKTDGSTYEESYTLINHYIGITLNFWTE